MIRLSSALRSDIMTSYGLGPLMQGGHIRLYEGTQPATADADDSSSILLGTITQQGLPVPTVGNSEGGLLLQGGDVGTLVNRGLWQFKGLEIGVIGWWRFVALGDLPYGMSAIARRLDGALMDAFDPAEIPTTAPGSTFAISAFTLTLPANP